MVDANACFVPTAQAFKDGKLSFEEFIDLNLRHFSGDRHLQDSKPIERDYDLGALSYGGNIGRVSTAIKICIREPGFVVPPVELLRPILLACPLGTLEALTRLSNTMESQSGISLFSNPYLLQIALLISLYYENNTLAKNLADVCPPPPRCILHMDNSCSPSNECTPAGTINPPLPVLNPSSLYAINRKPTRGIDREVLAHLINRRWAIPSTEMLSYAISSSDAASGISLFNALLNSKLDLSHSSYRATLPSVAAAWGEPQMLQHLLTHFKIMRPPNDLILVAVSERKSGGAAMIEYLLSHNINVNYSKPEMLARDEYAGYDPRARAEMEWAESQGSSGLGVPCDTALHLAAQNGNVEAVRVLLKRGARKNSLDRKGRTAFERARLANKVEVLDLLRE